MSTNLKGRLEIRLSPEDRDAVLNAAKSEGVNKSEWCRRVFASVLGTPKVETGPREAKDGLAASRLARPSIPSEAPASQGSEGVRPAVQSQTPTEETYTQTCGLMMIGSGTDTYDPTCELRKGHAGPCMSTGAIDQHRIELKPADAKAKPERITRPRRADVGPKPASASKPRPKTGKPARATDKRRKEPHA